MWSKCSRHPAARDLIFTDYFSPNEQGLFAPLRDTLLTQGHYMHLVYLTSCCQPQKPARRLYANPSEWTRKAILNVASSGKSQSTAPYATDIVKVEPCPIQ